MNLRIQNLDKDFGHLPVKHWLALTLSFLNKILAADTLQISNQTNIFKPARLSRSVPQMVLIKDISSSGLKYGEYFNGNTYVNRCIPTKKKLVSASSMGTELKISTMNHLQKNS